MNRAQRRAMESNRPYSKGGYCRDWNLGKNKAETAKLNSSGIITMGNSICREERAMKPDRKGSKNV